jgi:hypothetical protein
MTQGCEEIALEPVEREIPRGSRLGRTLPHAGPDGLFPARAPAGDGLSARHPEAGPNVIPERYARFNKKTPQTRSISREGQARLLRTRILESPFRSQAAASERSLKGLDSATRGPNNAS